MAVYWDDIDLNDLLARVIAVALETIADSEGKPYWLHSQEAFPFFVARIEQMRHDIDGEEIDAVEFRIRLRHITGHRTAGYAGEPEQLLNEQVPLLIGALLTCGFLQSAAYPDAPDWLEEVELESGGDVQAFDAAGVGESGQLQIGTDYVLRCAMRIEIEQRYN